MSSHLPSIYIDEDDDDYSAAQETFRSSATTSVKSPLTGRRDDEELDTFTKLLSEQMKLNKLQGAIRVCDRELLRSAIRDYDGARAAEAGEEDALGDDDDDDGGDVSASGVVTSRKGRAPDELRKARRLLDTIDRHDEALREACEARDRDGIISLLDNIRSSRLDRYLRDPMKAALELADALDTREVRMPILAMDKKTMCEIRSYAKPSPLVHRVMQAALLLLGEDEGTTEAWSKVQNFCSPDGPKGMNRRLMTFNPDDLHEFIVQRAFDLLKTIRLAEIQRASPGAATFYVWAMGVLKKKGCVLEDQQSASDPKNATGKKTAQKVSLDQVIKKEVEIFSAEAQRRANERKTGKTTDPRKNYS